MYDVHDLDRDLYNGPRSNLNVPIDMCNFIFYGNSDFMATAFLLISTSRIFPNHVSFTCAHYDTYVTPSLTMRRKPLPARSSGHDLTTLTPYRLARHPKTSTGCNTSRTHWRGLS